jgi:CRP/FNR family cyclic AMP-dependent transcriptional regulator
MRERHTICAFSNSTRAVAFRFSEKQTRGGCAAVGVVDQNTEATDASEPFLAGTFLARLHEQECAALIAEGSRRAFPRGTILMFEKELEERVMVVLDGRVKVTRVDQDGRELLLNIRDPGDVLGELALIDHEPRSATVSALEPVVALVLSGAAFRSYLESTPRAAVVLLEIVAARFREELSRRVQFTESDTMGRLAARLLELGDRYGEDNDGGIAVVLPISQEELASWVGASRAGVAAALQAMRELGWIRTERRSVFISDAPALRSRAA